MSVGRSRLDSSRFRSSGLVAARVDAERRALVLAVDDFQLTRADDDLIVSFELPAGAFATSVLRELGDFVDAMRIE